MIIHGKDRKLLLTVGASVTIADMCPDGDLTRIGEMMESGRSSKSLRFIAEFIHTLSCGYEESREFEEPGYKADPLSVKEIMTLTTKEIGELQNEALAAFRGDVQGEIELKESKKEDGATDPG